MGAKASKTKSDPSTNYENAQESEEEPVAELAQDLHSGPIHSLAAVDTRHLISGGADKDVILYSWVNHMYKSRYKGPKKDIIKVEYSPGAELILAGSRDRNIYAWKCSMETESTTTNSGPPHQTTATALRHQTIETPDMTIEGHTLGVTSLATNSAYPGLLCSGSRDNSVCLWDLEKGRPISTMHIPRNLVTQLKWVEGEKSVVQSSEDKTIKVWDLRSCSVVQRLKPKKHVQTCCAMSQDGKYILGGSGGSQDEGTELTLWDRRTEKKIKEYQGHSEGVQGCLFCSYHDNPGENLIVSVGNDSQLKLWNQETGECVHSELDSDAGPLTSVVSPSNGLVAYSSFRNGISIWAIDCLEKDKWSLNIRAKYAN